MTELKFTRWKTNTTLDNAGTRVFELRMSLFKRSPFLRIRLGSKYVFFASTIHMYVCLFVAWYIGFGRLLQLLHVPAAWPLLSLSD
jgi:hypothetical protein